VRRKPRRHAPWLGSSARHESSAGPTRIPDGPFFWRRVGDVLLRPVARMFHFAIRDNGVPPMIVVFVNGLSKRLWTNSKDGTAPIETVFIDEIIPHKFDIVENVGHDTPALMAGLANAEFYRQALAAKPAAPSREQRETATPR